MRSISPWLLAILLVTLVAGSSTLPVGGSVALAQEGEDLVGTTSTSTATDTVIIVQTRATSTLLNALQLNRADLTRPEADPEREEILRLLETRPVDSPTIFNFIAYWVQQSIHVGVPANTVVLILLIPILASLVTFVRIVIGLPTLEMLVPIILAFAFVAVGVVMGLIILGSIILASFVSRSLLREVKIMFFAKRSLSLLILSFFVFGALVAGVGLNIERVAELSIFPVLILTLLGDSIVTVQLHQRLRDTLVITLVTIMLGLIGYYLSTSLTVRDLIILYPEFVFLTIPFNLVVGRYFGLRLSEYVRFRSFQNYGSE